MTPPDLPRPARAAVFAAALAVSAAFLVEPALGQEGAAAAPAGGHDLSPWAMVLAADVVVKAVIGLLALASVATWTIVVAKGLELRAARARLRRTMLALDGHATLAEAAAALAPGDRLGRALIEAAHRELAQSGPRPDRDGVKERVASRIQRLDVAAGRALARGTGLLATIGSVGPFVGLFGTVWGIMNSFIGISKAQTTNLAVVAPGIAEALLATAIGLVAAIPAVIVYNHFSRSITGVRALVGDAAAAVLRLVSRDLDREVRGEPERAGDRGAVLRDVSARAGM